MKLLARIESLESRRLLSAGDLVTSFGTAGMADIGRAISPSESAVVPVAGDKFLLLTTKALPQQFQTPVAIIERHNADGSLDTTFGTQGIADYDFGDSFYGAKVASDGKIVVLSSIYSNPSVKRLNADGSLDGTFGTGGSVNLKEATSNSSFYISDFDLADDGKIFVLGSSSYLFRLTAGGVVDSTFTPFSYTHFQSLGIDQIQALPGGKVMLGGMQMEHAGQRFEFVQLTDAGVPDAGFGYYYNGFEVSGFLVQSDGKLLIASQGAHRRELHVRRITADSPGEAPLDVRIPFGKLQGRTRFAIAGDGKIIIYTNTSMARLNADGTYDASFGRLTSQYFAGQLDLGGALVRSNGDVVAAGAVGTDGRLYLLHGDNAADTTFYSKSGDTLTLTGTSGNDGFYIEPATDGIFIRRQYGFGRVLDATGIAKLDISMLEGNDRVQVYNTTMPTTISGGEGNDTIIASNGDDSILGDGGKDTLFGYGGNDTISGGASGDYIHGGDGDDEIFGNGGNDRIRGAAGNDTLHGNAGIDSFWTLEDTSVDHILGDGGGDYAFCKHEDIVASCDLVNYTGVLS